MNIVNVSEWKPSGNYYQTHLYVKYWFILTEYESLIEMHECLIILKF